MKENSITIDKSIYESLKQENKRLIAELQYSQQLFQLVIDNIPHSVFWKDRNSVYLGCNRNFAEDAGVGKPQNIVGKSDYDLPWAPAEADFFRECDTRIMESAIPEINIIETQVKANGKQFWLDTNKIPLRDNEGNVVGILGTYENITERNQIEEQLKRLNEKLEAKVKQRTRQLRKTENRLSRLTDNVPGMIYQFKQNPDGTMSFPYVSSGCLDIYEIEPYKIYENADLLFEPVHPEDLLELKEAIAYSAQTLKIWEYECQIITPSGKHKWLKGISKPQLQPDKSIIWDGCVVDITEQKNTEYALQKLNEELETRVEQRTAALHKTEARLKKLTDNVPGMIYEFCLTPDATMSFPYISSGFQEIFETEASQLQFQQDPKLLFSATHPDYLEALQESITSSAQTFENWQYEWLIITPSGKEKWIKGIAKPELQLDNSIIWYGCVVDITEIKKTEEERKILVSLVENSSDFIAYATLSGKSLFLNEAGRKLVGFDSVEQVINTPIVDYFFEPNEEDMLKQIYPAVKQHGIWREEARFKNFKTGEAISVDQTIFLIKNPQTGEAQYLATITRDITERKQAEEKLKASQHLIQRITESSPNILYIYDLEERRNIYANQKITEYLGYSKKEIQACGDTVMFHIIHPEDLEKIISQQQQVLAAADGDILEVEYRAKHSNGEYRWVYDRQTIFSRQEDGTVKQYLGVATDITKRKLAEIQVKQKAIELEKTLQKLQLTQAQLIQTEKMSSLGQLVAGVAHEINNPANFIYANLSFVREYNQDLLELLELYQQQYPNPTVEIEEKIENIELDFLKEDLQKIIISMEEGTRRIREIVLSLRNFSRLDESEFKKVDIHEGIESTLMILQNRLKAKPDFPGIEIIKEYGDLPLIECYPSQLNQVFMNILVNGIDALEEKIIKNNNRTPQVTIITKIANKKAAQIHIRDNGDGIPKNIISNIFDPFFTTKDVGKGTGLGLSVSYQIIVDKHGGKLSCQTIPSEGTNFMIEIPITHTD